MPAPHHKHHSLTTMHYHHRRKRTLLDFIHDGVVARFGCKVGYVGWWCGLMVQLLSPHEVGQRFKFLHGVGRRFRCPLMKGSNAVHSWCGSKVQTLLLERFECGSSMAWIEGSNAPSWKVQMRFLHGVGRRFKRPLMKSDKRSSVVPSWCKSKVQMRFPHDEGRCIYCWIINHRILHICHIHILSNMIEI